MFNPFDPGYYRSDELRGFGFARVGENVAIQKNCVIIGLGNIEIADDCRIDSGTTIVATNGRLVLAGMNHIGGGCFLSATGGDITFGRYSGTSQWVSVYTSTDQISGNWLMGPMPPREYVKYRSAAITIGEHVSIGTHSVLLPGSALPDGAVVGALSLVNRRLKPWGVYGGNPT